MFARLLVEPWIKAGRAEGELSEGGRLGKSWLSGGLISLSFKFVTKYEAASKVSAPASGERSDVVRSEDEAEAPCCQQMA